MKKFTLSYTYRVLKDGQTETTLKPSDELIDDYIATYKVYSTLSDATGDVDNLIAEMTPLLFAEFQQMDNIPLTIREQFEL